MKPLTNCILITVRRFNGETTGNDLPNSIIRSCRTSYNLSKVIGVSKSMDKKKRSNFNIGILLHKNFAKTPKRKLKKYFPRFENINTRQIEVTFFENWNSLCKHLLECEENPLFWNTTKEECLNLINYQPNSENFLDLLSRFSMCNDWEKIDMDSVLAGRISNGFETIQQLHSGLISLSITDRKCIHKILSKISNTKGTLKQKIKIRSKNYGSDISVSS